MPISTITPTETSKASRCVSPGARRSFLATLFGDTGAFLRRTPAVAGDEPLAMAHPQGEAWAAGLARGDQRKVGRRSPYAINHDIEALYASARAAGGAIALDLGDEQQATASLEDAAKTAGRKR